MYIQFCLNILLSIFIYTNEENNESQRSFEYFQYNGILCVCLRLSVRPSCAQNIQNLFAKKKKNSRNIQLKYLFLDEIKTNMPCFVHTPVYKQTIVYMYTMCYIHKHIYDYPARNRTS